MAEEEVPQGGVANAGGVVRVGPHGLRPAGPRHEAIHALLRHVAGRVAAGGQAFIDMWEAGGGQARFDRRRAWYAQERDRIAAALA